MFAYFSAKTYRPAHDDKILLIIENAIAEVASGARGLNFGLSIHLHPYFVYRSSEPLLLADGISKEISCNYFPKPA